MSLVADKSSPFVKLKPGPSLPPAEVAASQLVRIHEATAQVVAAKGYEALKVRDIVQLAKVSSRSFYKHFGSKEECFIRTYAAIAQEARIGLIGAQMEGTDWRERLRQVFVAFARALDGNPAAARLALIDVYTDGSSARAEAHRTEANFVSMLGKSLGRAPAGIAVPPLVVEGIMSGIARIACTRLLAGSEGELAESEDEIVEWALCFPGDATAELADLDLGLVRGNAALLEQRRHEAAIGPPGDNRAAIIAAAAKLCAADDYRYRDLTVPGIRAAAGVSRRTFDSHFSSVEDCIVSAFDQRATAAIADAATEQTAAASWEGGIYRAISSLCTEIATDPLLARVASQNHFPRGSKGARVRLGLVVGVADQIRAGAGSKHRAPALVAEASSGAIWGLFHHHVLRNWIPHRPEIAATLAYMALAPLVGGPAAVAAIRDEQVSSPASR